MNHRKQKQPVRYFTYDRHGEYVELERPRSAAELARAAVVQPSLTLDFPMELRR